MKKIILFVLIVLGLQSVQAQVNNFVPYRSNVRYLGIGADSSFYIPVRDTNFTPFKIGFVTIRPQDSLIYVGIKTTSGGKHWDLLSSRIGAVSIDTAGKWITDVYKKSGTDSVFKVKGGVHTFAYLDTGTGGGGAVVDSLRFVNNELLLYQTGGDDLNVHIPPSILDIDSTYEPLAGQLNDSTWKLKSVRVKMNGTEASKVVNDRTIDINLTLFDGETDGIVPASTGTTTDFLRADGTWAAPAGGGAAQTLEDVLDTGDSLTKANFIKTKTGSITYKGKDSIGAKFTYNWTNNPLTTWNTTGSLTITPDGTKTRISGGALGVSHGLSLVLPSERITVPNFTITQSVVPQAKSGTSYGFGIRLLSFIGTNAVFNHFMLSDTAGYVAQTYTASEMPSSTSVMSKNKYKFSWSTGDTLDLTVEFRGNRGGTVMMFNRNNKSMVKITVPSLGTRVFQPGIFFYGGTWDMVGPFKITYDDLYQPEVYGIGDSHMWAQGSFNNNSFFEIATSGVKGGAVNNGHPSEYSLHGTYQTTDLVNFIKPKNIIYAYGYNDANGGYGAASFSTNLDSFVRAIRTGLPTTRIFFKSGPPGPATMSVYNDTMAAVAGRYGIKYITDYEPLLGSGTSLDSRYNFDGAHLNQQGHNVMGRILYEGIKDSIDFSPAIVYPDLPLAADSVPRFLLGLTNAGVLSRYRSEIGDSYLKNKKPLSTELIANGQTADLFLNGNGIVKDFKAVGNGTLAAPVFNIATSTITMNNAAYVYFGADMVHYPSDNSLRLANNAYISFNGASNIRSANGNPIIIKNIGWGAGYGSYSLKITNGDTYAPSSTYKIAGFFYHNGTTETLKSYIDKDGAYKFGTLTSAEIAALTGMAAGTTVYCSDCTATDASTGVIQTYNGSTWKNHW